MKTVLPRKLPILTKTKTGQKKMVTSQEWLTC